MMKDKKSPSTILFALSIVAIILAAIVNLTATETILGLAGTQWILVAIALAVYAVYAGTCCSCGTKSE